MTLDGKKFAAVKVKGGGVKIGKNSLPKNRGFRGGREKCRRRVGGSRSTDARVARRTDRVIGGGRERERLNAIRPSNYVSGKLRGSEREVRKISDKAANERSAAGRTGARNTFEHTVDARRTPTD